MTDYIRDRDDIAAVILLYTVLATSMADWGLTVIGLGHGAVELNPMMAPVFAMPPVYSLAVKTSAPIVCTLMYLVLRRDAHARKWALGTLLMVAALGIVPIAWNLVQLGRIR